MFTVKIITKLGETTIVEKAGLRKERTMLSIADPNGIRTNPKPKKLEGFKTRKGALSFIAEALAVDVENGWDSWYQIEEA